MKEERKRERDRERSSGYIDEKHNNRFISGHIDARNMIIDLFYLKMVTNYRLPNMIIEFLCF